MAWLAEHGPTSGLNFGYIETHTQNDVALVAHRLIKQPWGVASRNFPDGSFNPKNIGYRTEDHLKHLRVMNDCRLFTYHCLSSDESSRNHQSGTSPSIWNCLQLRWNASAFGTAPGSPGSSSTRSDQPQRMMEMRPSCWCFSTGKALMPCFQLMLILGKRQQEAINPHRCFWHEN